MCRLLAVSVNKITHTKDILSNFRELSLIHGDGWGIAFWDDNLKEFERIRSAKRALDDDVFEGVRQTLRSNHLIAHVRLASSPLIAREHFSHPFRQKIGNHEFVFAHNGSIFPKERLQQQLINHFPEKGIEATDSEIAFCFLMDKVQENLSDVAFSDHIRMVSVLEDALQQMFEDVQGTFNFLLADSNYIYAFNWDYMEYVIRDPETEKWPSSEEERKIWSKKNERGEKAIIICSEGFTYEDWHPIGRFELVVLKNGEIIYRRQLNPTP